MANAIAQTGITVEQYHQMFADGILHEDDRVELIEGELHWSGPISPAHAACVNRLAALFQQQLARKVHREDAKGAKEGLE